MKIWIDSDACPKVVKEIVFKASFRLEIPVCLVANSYMKVPHGGLVTSVQVEQGDDVADMYIAQNCLDTDLVITQDIPLASQIVAMGATAINPRGEIYTLENIQERLSVRDFMHELRENGVDTGGPSAYSDKDRQNFANSLNKLLS